MNVQKRLVELKVFGFSTVMQFQFFQFRCEIWHTHNPTTSKFETKICKCPKCSWNLGMLVGVEGGVEHHLNELCLRNDITKNMLCFQKKGLHELWAQWVVIQNCHKTLSSTSKNNYGSPSAIRPMNAKELLYLVLTHVTCHLYYWIVFSRRLLCSFYWFAYQFASQIVWMFRRG